MKLDPFTCLGSYDFQLNTEIVNDSKIEIYPNPNSGNFMLSGIEKSSMIHLYDALGRLRNYTVTKTAEAIQITGEGLEAGIYFIRISSEKGKELETKRFSIIR
jgi:hypothetical protein